MRGDFCFMSNELRVDFIANDNDAKRKTDAWRDSLKKLNEDINSTGKSSVRSFTDDNKRAFEDLNKRAKSVSDSFKKLSETRINKGQFDTITQGAIVGERSINRLQNEIRRLQKEASDPSNRNFGKFYAQGIREAEQAVERLEYRMRSLNRQSGGGGFGGRNFGGGNLGGYAAQALGGLPGGSIAAGIALGGAIGGGAALIFETVNAVKSLATEAKELAIQSISLAGDFEQSTNAVAVFSGGIASARHELALMDKVALDTNGLRLQSAEIGYQQLRALNFEAKVARDLISGLGIQRVLSGASDANVQRAITNLQQLRSEPRAVDIKQIITNLPSTKTIFEQEFGTGNAGRLKEILEANPERFFERFASALANARQANAGLNISVEKLKDTVVDTGRTFGEPFLKPLTNDVQSLTGYIRENKDEVRVWGQSLSDTLNGVVRVAKGARVVLDTVYNRRTSPIIEGVGFGLFQAGTGGLGGAAIGAYKGLEYLGSDGKITGFAEGVVDLGKSFEEDEEKRLKKERERENARKKAIELRNSLFVQDIQNRVEYAKALFAAENVGGSGIEAIRRNAQIEEESLRNQIELRKDLARQQVASQSKEEILQGARFVEISASEAADIAKLENQIQVNRLQARKAETEEIKRTKTEFRDFLVTAASENNPFVKLFSDAETAAERLNEKFKNLTASQRKMAVEAELARIRMQTGENRADFASRALTSRQEAFRLQNTPENQFAPFKRSMEIFERSVDKFAGSIELNRKIAEASYYANTFNPNNPRSFNDSRYSFAERDVFASTAGERRKDESFEDYQKRRNEEAEKGVQVQDAVNNIRAFEIKSLRQLGSLGVQGRGAIAEKILGMIPSREELLKRLSSPFALNRENAQSLLSSQANAYFYKQQADNAKFNDFLKEQQFGDLNKQFTREQLSQIGSMKDLSRESQVNRSLNILNALGNDLDAELKQTKFNLLLESGKINEKKEEDAARRTAKIDKIIGLILGEEGGNNGIPVSLPEGALSVGVQINAADGISPNVQQSPKPKDTEKMMNGTWIDEYLAGN